MKSPEMPAKPETPDKGDRIAKLLARAGIASRREVERMIAEGRVTIGGETVTTPATILTSLHGVSVDGVPVAAAPPPPRLFRFHKPSGLITAERDPTGRPTIYTALRNAMPPGAPRVMPVGRLDLNTEGLLLMTNDGEMKRALELPASGIPRTYRARTFGEVSQAMLEDLMDGIEIEGIRYGPINANMERSTGHNKWIELTLTEGKNREVRRVLEHLGLQVSRLMRLAYGPFILADLPRGAVEEVRPADVERFRATLKIAPASFAGAAVLPVRPLRATPRRPESVVPSKAAAKPARPADKRPAEVRPAEKKAPPKHAPRRDADRDATLVDRPKLGRAKPAPRAVPAKPDAGAEAKPAKISTKGWARAKPKSKRIGPRK